MAEATVIDISPVRRTTALTPRTTGDGESGSGFNALKWAMELLFVNKQTATSLREISSTLLGIRSDNARYEQARNETAQQAREQLERQQEAGQDVVQRRENLAPQPIRKREKERDSSSFLRQLGRIFDMWKTSSYIGRGIMAAVRNAGKIFTGAFRVVQSIGSMLGGIANWLGIGSGAAGIASVILGGAAAALWSGILYGILDKWGKAHKLFENKKEEGRLGIAQDEAKALGIKTADETGAPKERKELAREVANKLQETGQITPDDRKAAGVAEYKAGQGFTDDDAMKLLEYRQRQRNEEKYKKQGLQAAIAASMAGPSREVGRMVSGPPSTSTTLPSLPNVSTTLGTIEGGGLPVEEVIPSSTLPIQAFTAPSVSPTAISSRGAKTPIKAPDASGVYKTKTDFLAGMYPLAAEAAEKIGNVDPYALLTQWGLESAWGSKLTGDYNYFGIKASRDWKGEVAQSMTREVIGGKEQRMTQPFRSYSSAKEAVNDYVRFVKQPRYRRQGIERAKTATEYFTALQKGGYATDPAYASKLASLTTQTSRAVQMTSMAQTRQAAPLQAGTAQLAQAQMQAPVVMAVNMSGGGRQAPAPPQSVMPVPIRPRSQDDTIRAMQFINATS